MTQLKKILMVDDDADLREALADQLVLTEEFDVFEAGDGVVHGGESCSLGRLWLAGDKGCERGAAAPLRLLTKSTVCRKTRTGGIYSRRK